MIRVEEALQNILAAISPLEPTDAAIEDALDLVLAQDIESGMNIPPWDNSAMDGYAVRAEDIVAASADNPITLPVIDEVAAGKVPKTTLRPGTAIRIMTGAPVPPGADTVVRFEDTDEEERRAKGQELTSIAILQQTELGEAVRLTGEDVKVGERVLEAGSVLSPGHIGVLASLGLARVPAVRRPTVAILSTGDEVVAPGGELGPGQIYDSNSHSVAALVKRLGATPHIVGIAKDTVEDLSAKIRTLRDFDFVLSSAGVSMGYYDVVKEVLASHGELSLWTVQMRPGKPVAFGMLTGSKDKPWPRPVPLLGLPGNPVSAMVVFHVLARPAILKLMGRTQYDTPTVEAILEDPIRNSDGRRTYARAFVEKRNGSYYARMSGSQGSNILTAMARANGLAVCPEDVPGLKAGDTAQVILLD